jgi:hypothetical protein
VCLSICLLALVTFVVQRQVLVYLNKKKEATWKTMSVQEQARYQADNKAREKDGNRRLDFRFVY